MFSKLSLVAATGVAGALLSAGAASASVAHPHPAPFGSTVVAHTQVFNRPDSGGNGNWASDFFIRTLTIHKTGPASLASCGTLNTLPCYSFTASLSDSGKFYTYPGAFTPNQGAPFTGTKLPSRSLSGPMAGSGGFGTFYATALPSASSVPHFVFGSNDPSPTWPELAFPAGTVTGLNEGTFSYGYSATVTHIKTVTVIRHRLVFVRVHNHWVLKSVAYTTRIRVPVTQHQHWTDADFNGSGQTPAAGNITG
jgi:hypothetical protein